MNAISDVRGNAGERERLRIRTGAFTGPTSGLAPGNVQANLVILPKALAARFPALRRGQPEAVPDPGGVRTGRSRVSHTGRRPGYPHRPAALPGLARRELVAEPTDVRDVWRDDLVSFAIGCSFSFEEALIEDGIEVRHIARGSNVPMYRTNIPCVPAGVFSGPLVVSMRPLKPADAIRAVQITSRFPSVHGAPVHLGFPASIGIADIGKPDYGDAVPIAADEMPVFWACGVTPQAVIAQVRPEFCITHAPGSMLITDLRNTSLAAL